ncbi:alpha/beta fold hydrolase [Chitinophaga ginsengisoli]|uniref:Pimeloyl-ACP methyl ester carboxylesterase n=1 Tax=Chitinophaga ginsengisoli TaxID=363837 RepID=A0A2P8GKE7_9BACT|nr:alpha/beta hydrolase [Chitinophaga ginsengisoli]PSL34436.1 pimeloyl-ACP methyl ester carboxylesterase [Chitinophaga ginsengisoli]
MRNNRTITSMKRLALFAILALGIASCDKDETPAKDDTTVTVDYHQTATTQFIESGDTKYAYRVLGQKEGTPLVILSPLGGSLDDWDPAITNGLAQKNKVIIFDNQGVGSSTGKTPATIADMAKGAVTFIKALGYTKVNLMGFSMGGFVTQQIALTEPALVNKIILTGTGPKGSEGLSNLPNLLSAAAGLSPKESFLLFGFTSSAESRSAGEQSYARVQKRTVNRDAPVSNESFGAQLTAVLAWAQPYPNALKELETITQPVLHIQGQKDVPVPVINAVNMSQHIPNARLSVYPDAGHAAFTQYPEQFVEQANDFLK